MFMVLLGSEEHAGCPAHQWGLIGCTAASLRNAERLFALGEAVETLQFDLSQLTQPALLPIRGSGPLLSAAERAAAETVLAAVRRCLGDEVGVEPATVWCAEARDAGSASWRLGFELGPSDPEAPALGWIAIDEDLARALVDRIERRHAGICGYGRLTDVERGALEYLALRALDDALDAAREALGSADGVDGIVVRRALDDADLRKSLSTTAGPRVDVEFKLGARCGRAGMFWAAGISTPVQPPAPAQRRSDRLQLELVLPQVSLSKREATALGAGDLLLLGGDGSALGQGMAVVTSTGWRLGSATLLQSNPRSWTVRLEAAEPEPYRPEQHRSERDTDQSGNATATARIGAATLSVPELQRALRSGGGALSIEFGCAVTVHLSPTGTALPGELVRCDAGAGEELAVRLLEPTREPAPQPHNAAEPDCALSGDDERPHP